MMAKKKSRHLTPINDPSLLFAEVSVKYKELEKRSAKISKALETISDSGLLSQHSKDNIKTMISDCDKSKTDFEKNLRRNRRRSKKKHLSVLVESKPKIVSVVEDLQQSRILSPEELMYSMNMDNHLAKDYNLNPNLNEMEKRQIFKKIVQFNDCVRRYRRFYGKNPLKWTPQERMTVSNIYDCMAREYQTLHYEEGYERYSMIARNLRDNPLNKIRQLIPSAPRGNTKATNPKTFCKFVDGE